MTDNNAGPADKMPDLSSEDLAVQIQTLAEQIRNVKAAGQPPETWQPMLDRMLAAKAQYQELTGEAFGGNEKASKTKEDKKSTPQQQEAASDKNKAKREAKAAEKAVKEAKKAAQRAEREARERSKLDKMTGVGQDNFGDAPMVQSQRITTRSWTRLPDLLPGLATQTVLVRGHLQTTRLVGKGVFVLVRSSLHSVQGVAFVGNDVSDAMIKYIANLPLESVVDMEGTVTVPNTAIESATQSGVEIQIKSFHAVCKAQRALPFVMEDACRPETGQETDIGANVEEDDEIVGHDGVVRVGQKMRLDYRWLDLRTPANQAIFRIESMVGCLFRECLLRLDFVEIHTPKLIGGASEGGSDVFQLDYFGTPACLAMSPQLHKQMTAACSGFERVFTTGPVFRAENSNTRRHLCEFTGLDLEMVIYEHYDEVLDVLSDLFIYIFDGLNQRCASALERVREQHPFQNLQYLRPTLRITFAEGVQLLRDAGVTQGEYEDLSTENEKKLGDIVKQKYGTDFFFMDQYPLAVRPFYTMPSPDDPQRSNSFDVFIRGQEIISGAQRIHDPDLLEDRARAHGIDLADIRAYVDSFRHGALPHGGAGIGLERVVMLFLGLPNIRKAAWFPRDPRRIAP